MKSSLLFSLVFIFLNVELVCIIAMEVLPIFKNYFQIHGALKFHTMGCTSYAESIVHFDECRIKAIDRAHNSINVRASIKKTLSSVIIIDSISIIYIFLFSIYYSTHASQFFWIDSGECEVLEAGKWWLASIPIQIHCWCMLIFPMPRKIPPSEYCIFLCSQFHKL